MLSALRTRRTRRPRGFVLIVVLMLIALLMVVCSLALSQSSNVVTVSSAVKSYEIAQSRAAQGIMQMRAETLNSIGAMSLLAPCTMAQVDANTCGSVIKLTKGYDPVTDAVNFPTVPAGVPWYPGSSDLTEGAGMQYRTVLFNMGPNTGTSGRFFIVSTGFYGQFGSPNLRQARIEVELSLPSGVTEKVCPSGVAGSC